MLQKALKKFCASDILECPALVNHYIDAHDKVLGVFVKVNPSHYAVFDVFTEDLQDLKIDPKTYSVNVVQILRSWLKLKNFRSVPIRVFCGDWALGKFLKVDAREYVKLEVDDDASEILQSELTVARYYIAGNIGNYMRLS